MDTLPDLRRKDKNKGVCGYCPCKIPAVLSKVQEGNTGRCHTTENGIEQMSQTQKVQSQLSIIKNGEAGSFHLIGIAFWVCRAVSTA